MPTPASPPSSQASILLLADRSDEAEDLLDLFGHEHRSCRWLTDEPALVAELAASTPDILILARSDRSQVVQCLQLGARGFIVKPFSKQTLLEAIGRQLGSQAVSF